MSVNHYRSDMSAANGELTCLNVAMLYRPNSHHGTNSAEVAHLQHNTLRPRCPPPSYESLPPSPPAYESRLPPAYESLPPPSYDLLSPPPPAYEALPPPPYESMPPPAYETLASPPPPYSRFPSSSSLSSQRPVLPPISALLSSMGCASSSPPPPYTRLPPTTTVAAAAAAPRFPIFHTRYFSANNEQDSSQDRHKLYILTSSPATEEDCSSRARGIYLHLTGSRRCRRSSSTLCFKESPGNVPESTRGLRESTLLGSISADDLDALVSTCRQAHLELLAKRSASQRKRPPLRSNKAMTCRFLLYTLDAPPPPYSKNHVLEPLALASPSQEWVAAVIALTLSSGLLQRNQRFGV